MSNYAALWAKRRIIMIIFLILMFVFLGLCSKAGMIMCCIIGSLALFIGFWAIPVGMIICYYIPYDETDYFRN
jgi:hypothetical protein